MFANGPKGGLAARVGHKVANEVIDAPDKRKVIFSQSKPGAKGVRNAQTGINKQKAKSNYATRMMGVQQVHELKNFGFVPPYTALFADSKVHHNKAKFATGGDVVQVMFDVGQEDIQS